MTAFPRDCAPKALAQTKASRQCCGPDERRFFDECAARKGLMGATILGSAAAALACARRPCGGAGPRWNRAQYPARMREDRRPDLAPRLLRQQHSLRCGKRRDPRRGRSCAGRWRGDRWRLEFRPARLRLYQHAKPGPFQERRGTRRGTRPDPRQNYQRERARARHLADRRWKAEPNGPSPNPSGTASAFRARAHWWKSRRLRSAAS